MFEQAIDQLLSGILLRFPFGGQRGIAGQDVTPFVLSFLHDRSGGATLRANKELVAANAGLAAEVAVAAR